MGGVAGSNLEKLELQLLRQGLSLGGSGAHTAASPANQQRKQDRPKPSVGISANKELRVPVPEPVVSGCAGWTFDGPAECLPIHVVSGIKAVLRLTRGCAR